MLNGDGTLATASNWNTTTTASTGGQVFADQTDGYTNHRYMNADGVTLTGSTLQVKVTDKDSVTATFSVLNAMRITTVPEPTTAGLCAMGALLWAGVRRRRW